MYPVKIFLFHMLSTGVLLVGYACYQIYITPELAQPDSSYTRVG